MEKQILKILAGCVILGLLVFASCRKIDKFDDLRVVNYDAEFAIPLFNATASFQDILEKFDEDTYIEIGTDDLITVFYKGDVIGRTSNDILATLNQDLLAFEVTDTIFGVDMDTSENFDIEIDYAIFKNSLLSYVISDTTPGPIIVTVKFPNVTLDGVPLEKTTTHNVSPTNGLTAFVGPIDLLGYKFTPDNDSFFVEYHAYRPDLGYYDKVETLAILIQDFAFSYLEGYMGNDIYELDRDTIVIDFFENWTRGDVFFQDPKINLIIENSFGFPVRSKVNELIVHSVDNDTLHLQSPFLDSVTVAYPSLNEVGETKYTYFNFNKDNSNIDSILGFGPVAIDYDFDVVANPDNNSAIRGFITETSEMSVQVEVELPMYGTASGFEARDTFDINFDEYQDFDDVEFKLISENGIPLDVGIQIYFAKQDGTVLDSLFTPNGNILEAAPVDAEGLPTMITEKITYTSFEGSRFEKIKSAKKILLRASFSTVNNGETIVKILSTQEVKIRMGMKIGVSG